MNLKGLYNRIANEMQFAPNSQQYKDDVHTLLNDIYLATCSAQRWQFLEKTVKLQLYADIETLYDSDTTPTSDVPYVLTELDPPPETHWEGAFFETAGGEVFEISAVDVGNEQAYPVWGTHPENTEADQSAGWVRFYRYLLPEDCVDVLGIVKRSDDYGEIVMVDRTQERELLLNEDEVGQPQCFISDYLEQVRAPREDLQLEVDPVAGDYPAGTYRYLIARYVAGRYSSPSNVASATVPVGTSAGIELANIYEPSRPDAPYHVFRDDGDGRFRKLKRGDGRPFFEYGSTMTDDYSFDLSEHEIWYETDRRAIRFYPRPDTDQEVELRYIFKPRRLMTDNDSPVIPEQYQMLLVHRTVARLALRKDPGSTFAAMHTKLADELEKQMRRRYIDDSAQNRQRQDWSPVAGRLVRKARVSWSG